MATLAEMAADAKNRQAEAIARTPKMDIDASKGPNLEASRGKTSFILVSEHIFARWPKSQQYFYCATRDEDSARVASLTLQMFLEDGSFVSERKWFEMRAAKYRQLGRTWVIKEQGERNSQR